MTPQEERNLARILAEIKDEIATGLNGLAAISAKRAEEARDKAQKDSNAKQEDKKQ